MNISTKTDCRSHVRWTSEVKIATFCALWLLSIFASPDLQVGVLCKPKFYRDAHGLGASPSGTSGLNPSAEKPLLDESCIASKFQEAQEKVVILDYDGTLAEFHPKPEMAVPSSDLVKVLEQLNQDDKTLVAIISGRDQNFLQRHFGRYEKFLLSAEHGAYELSPGKSYWSTLPEPKGLDNSWKEKVKEEMRKLQPPSGTRVEVKQTGVVFHYRDLFNADHKKGLELGEQVTGKMKTINPEKLIVEHDACAVDVRPNQFTKGAIAVSAWQKKPNAKIVLCLGDGKTDEAMFGSLQQHHAEQRHNLPPGFELITAHVVNNEQKPTIAKYQIANVPSVIRFLKALCTPLKS